MLSLVGTTCKGRNRMRAKFEPRATLLASLAELIEACPGAQCNPWDCPLYQVRKMARPERSEWFRALNQDDLSYLATYHYVCLETRLAELRKASAA
jgi:hypothetical protein